jgi:hypothetical protein
MPSSQPIKRSITSLTDEQRLDLATRYPHEPTVSLAAEFGLSINQVANFAQARELHKTPEGYRANRRKPDSLTADIEVCVQAAGPQGLDATGILRALRDLYAANPDASRDYITAHQVRCARVKLVQQARIHPARIGPTQLDQRWYGQADWVPPLPGGQPRPPSAAQRKATELAEIHERRRTKAADAEARRRAHINTPTANPGQVPVQVLPGAPESRWAGLKVTEPTFSSRRPGQYLDHEPPAWVRAACREPLPKAA